MPSPEIEEEQQLEMEALGALFTHEDEFTQLSSNSCLLRLLPYGELGSKDPHNLVSAHLFFEFTENYPHEMPVWRVETSMNLFHRRSGVACIWSLCIFFAFNV